MCLISLLNEGEPFEMLDCVFQALISVTPDEETYDEEDAAFCLEMLLRIVLENRYITTCVSLVVYLEHAHVACSHWVSGHQYKLCVCVCVCPGTACRVCGRRCETTCATCVSTPTRAASWWRGLWSDSSDWPSACCDERTSALRYSLTHTHTLTRNIVEHLLGHELWFRLMLFSPRVNRQ